MLNKKKVPLTLVSLNNQTFCRDIKERLLFLGYENIDVLGTNELLDTELNHLTRVLIFPIVKSRNLQRRMHKVLEKTKEKPVLSIIQTLENNLNINLLDYCNEFLSWPFTENEFALRLDRLCSNFQVISEHFNDAELIDAFVGLNLVGSSPSFLTILKQIKKFAHFDAPVLIEGETGTGKELAARAIHYMSKRSGHPFIPVNCGAIPDSLLENELFGHEKGAFTDAKKGQAGLICQANGGTLFLDEVETFSPKGQVVLLRFLQDQRYKPLGHSQQKQANVRIIVACNANLSDMVNKGIFRQDLFFRINIMSIKMPSLSQRMIDIGLLAEYFLDKYKLQYNQPEKYLHPDTITWMNDYNWPGNVRELENLLHREFIMAEGPSIKFGVNSTLPKERRINIFDRRQALFLNSNFNEAKRKIINQFEKKYLGWLISESNGNVTMAAKRAGKERRALGKLLKKHGIS